MDILSKDGSNIVQIVETKYEEISTSIQMSAGTSGTGTKVRFFSDCGGSGEIVETRRCSNVQLGTPLRFLAELENRACGSGTETIPIFSLGLNESLVLSVSTDCRCPCEDEPSSGVSDLCRGQGRLVCGECSCNPGHYGRSCECDGQAESIGEDLCRAGPEDPAVCSGRGECNCGVCTCAPNPLGLVSGIYCECDDWTCPRSKDGALCSRNGLCRCGSCSCFPGWTGDTCDCNQSPEPCVSPYDGEVCSGNGECSCGTCVCRTVDSGSALYTGSYCERNPTGGIGACGEVRDCVECQQFPSQQNQENCSSCVFQSKTKEVGVTKYVSVDLDLE